MVSASSVSALQINGAGEKVTLTDALPAGLEVLENSEGEPEISSAAGVGGTAGSAACSSSTVAGSAVVLCTYEGVLPPYEALEVRIRVKVGGVSGALNRISVSGGGAPSMTAGRPAAIGSEATPFGVEQYELTPENADGSAATQAGAHPFQLTNTLTLNSGPEIAPEGSEQPHKVVPPAMVKDLRFKLPPGLVGNPTAFPQCTAAQFSPVLEGRNNCPTDTQIGVAQITFYEPAAFGLLTLAAPLFNLVPAPGEPARFGFVALVFPITIGTSIRTGGDYGVTASVLNTTELPVFMSSQVSFWGDPGDPRHDPARGQDCLGLGRLAAGCTEPEDSVDAPLLTMPSVCGDPLSEPLESSVSIDSWADPSTETEPSVYRWHDGAGTPLALDGCDKLGFEPSLSVAPDGQAASTPTGLSIDQHIPQEEILTPKGLAQSDVKDIAVTFPEGVTLNPASADGLEACSEGQIGFAGVEHPSGVDLFTPKFESPFCPDASKIGTVKIKTPILPDALEGAVYLAAQNANPFGSLIAVYIAAEDPVSGVVVKLPGEVSLNPQTGQISATFVNLPQAPFEDAEFQFFGGERAPLATPAHCGRYTTNVLFTPSSGGAPVNTTSSFEVTSGPNHGPCPGQALPFAPALAGGTTTSQAGAFSPLTTTISREDGQQSISSVQLHYPPGVSGVLAGVPLCPEAEANAGTCGAESQIGETIVSVGLGADPFSVTGGKVYLTEKYAGAPFGLSIVNPAKAGPFDLQEGRPVVVRAKIEVDPRTAALTITTDSSGPHSIPTIIEGIPLQIKHVNVTITRPRFTFNPTDCNPLSITGAIDSAQGSSSPVSVPFQAVNCATLRFVPKIAVSTGGHASKANGAALAFKIVYPAGSLGSQSWFSEAKFDLPKQLSARLTTLQQACLAATFEANPAGCPAASLIGHASVHTPVLPVPLNGPVYFVSYGGAKFPEAVLVLQGDGVTVDLHGETFIAKDGLTSATFRNTPDVPFESIEVTIPTGPFSEFGANLPTRDKYSFCGQKLVMPTLFKAQNGLEINENTPIAVTGCPNTHTRAQKLAAALKACHKDKQGKRVACEHSAREKYRTRAPKTSKNKKK